MIQRFRLRLILSILQTKNLYVLSLNIINQIGVSSGFDCQLIFWNLETKNIMKIINVNEILAKYIPGQLFSTPLVYNVSVNKATVCVSVETGHVMAINYKEPKKVNNSEE